jgi:hypothetical protein
MELMLADTAEDVIGLLKDGGYWDDPASWRNLGDSENNYASIGNQQSEAVASLIEKLVNGVDARLLNACLLRGIEPESPAAPVSIRSAVARFFEDKTSFHPDRAGRIAFWTDQRLTEEGRLLTLSATGRMPDTGLPCLTIADQGEGQTPDSFPDTFMSLGRSNKLRVHFVQGKFNMGGTGALTFCRDGLQLVVSRRNPALLPADSPLRAHEWGFTIVRRQPPEHGERSSVFTYLAPVPGASGRGSVLTFAADAWPIFPDATSTGRGACQRESAYGSLVKLYEYRWQGTKSNIVSSGGALLRRIDQGLPELALPIRLFECRSGYRGHSGSFATNARGIVTRLELDKANNLEDGFPRGSVFDVKGFEVQVRAYAFRPRKADDYRERRNAVIFAVNGQTHAGFSTDFFRRKSVGLSYLADSLLVIVDCTNVSEQMREDLFMNSRDRLRDSDIARDLEQRLESFLHAEPSLKELRNKRRDLELQDKLRDSRPLSDALKDLLRSDPALARLFLQGLNLPVPFPSGAGAKNGQTKHFVGKRFPTYFRFKGLQPDAVLRRDLYRENRARIAFETDARDDYFSRDDERGTVQVVVAEGESTRPITSWWTTGPQSGVAQLWFDDASEFTDGAAEAEVLIEVTDDSRPDSFLNKAIFHVRDGSQPAGGVGVSSKAQSSNAGEGSTGGASALALPNIVEVVESEWAGHDPQFNDETALVVKHAGDASEGSTEEPEDAHPSADVYDFFVNVDNRYLRTAQKVSSADPKLLKARFTYSLVLIGMALLRSNLSGKAEEGDRENQVAQTTRAVAPVLLPMIESMGSLTVEDELEVPP